MEKEKNTLEWDFDIPIMTNRFVMKGVAVALGIPTALITLFVTISYFNDRRNGMITGEIDFSWIPKAILVLLLLFGLTALLLFATYRNKMQTHFKLDEKGVEYYTREESYKKASKQNWWLLILGLFQNSPSAVSAAAVSQLTLSGRIKWKNVKKVKYHDSSKAIYISEGFGSKIMLYGDNDNYDIIKQYVEKQLSR